MRDLSVLFGLPSIATEKAVQPSRHVRRYLSRLDHKLADLDPLQQEAFLVRERTKWIARYERFATKVDSGKAVDESVTAWDYVETITAISARLGERTC